MLIDLGLSLTEANLAVVVGDHQVDFHSSICRRVTDPPR
jgi:hypothetical protein